MLKLFSFLLVLGLCISCEKRTIVKRDSPNPDFLTPPDGTLYFKNVRQIDYHRVKPRDINMFIYHYKDRPVLKEKPQIWAYIAENWEYEEAYFMLESNDLFGEFTESTFSYTSGKDSTYRPFKAERYHKSEFLRFADFVTGAFADDSPVYMRLPQGDSLQIFIQKEEREAFRITYMDYKKWIGKPIH
jgi:hypothetical protein